MPCGRNGVKNRLAPADCASSITAHGLPRQFLPEPGRNPVHAVRYHSPTSHGRHRTSRIAATVVEAPPSLMVPDFEGQPESRPAWPAMRPTAEPESPMPHRSARFTGSGISVTDNDFFRTGMRDQGLSSCPGFSDTTSGPRGLRRGNPGYSANWENRYPDPS